MPIHDWTRVEPGLFHHFHQDWTAEIARTLNRGLLPKGFAAYIEQRVGGPEPDVIAVETGGKGTTKPKSNGTTAVLDEPRARIVQRLIPDGEHYAQKANRVAIRHHLGEVVAVIEVVSPGNKDGREAFQDFIDKAVEFLKAGVHLLLIDLFPPTRRDPHGIHKAILKQFGSTKFKLPAGKTRTLASYCASPPKTGYIEPLAIGDALPDMPLFLSKRFYIQVPLEPTYQATWEVCPAPIRELVS